jgi:hypothetical protein
MRKNIFLWILTVLLLLFNLSLMYKYKQQKNSINDLTNKTGRITDREAWEAEELKEATLIQQLSEAYPCQNIEIKNPKTKENILLHSLLKEHKVVLFFRFKENDCDACIQHATKTLSEIAEHFPEMNIVILSGYGNVRQFYAYAQTENHQLSVYNVNHLSIPVDDREIPYFFILTPALKIQNIFILDKSDPTLTIRYLNVMQEKYWPGEHDHTHCTHDHHSH